MRRITERHDDRGVRCHEHLSITYRGEGLHYAFDGSRMDAVLRLLDHEDVVLRRKVGDQG